MHNSMDYGDLSNSEMTSYGWAMTEGGGVMTIRTNKCCMRVHEREGREREEERERGGRERGGEKVHLIY